jgi:hypothetical protein
MNPSDLHAVINDAKGPSPRWGALAIGSLGPRQLDPPNPQFPLRAPPLHASRHVRPEPLVQPEPTRFSSSGGNDAASASIASGASPSRSPIAFALYDAALRADAGWPLSSASHRRGYYRHIPAEQPHYLAPRFDCGSSFPALRCFLSLISDTDAACLGAGAGASHSTPQRQCGPSRSATMVARSVRRWRTWPKSMVAGDLVSQERLPLRRSLS